MCEPTVHTALKVNEDTNNTLKAFNDKLEQLTTEVGNLRLSYNVMLNHNDSDHEDLYEYLRNLEYTIANVNQMHGSLLSDVLKTQYKLRSCKRKCKLRIKIENWIDLQKDKRKRMNKKCGK